MTIELQDHAEALSLLIDAGANITKRNMDAETALHIAARLGKTS